MTAMKIALPLCALLCSSCVNGKLNPLVSQIVSGLDTTGCELVTAYVANQEAGDVCNTASKFFNGILSSFSTQATLALAPVKSATPLPKWPVKYQGVTVGHFYAPYCDMVQGKLDVLPVNTAYDLTR